jgi:hypothetical protein
MSKHCFHYGFAGWLRLRKLASFAENVRDDRTPEPSQSPVRRIAGITISSPHTPRTKARRSKPHRALITVLKGALLCMNRASFASKICSAFSRFEHIAASINLVLRSALILRRACPTWGARLEGLRASRRTATSEIERAAILRDGRMQTCALLRMRPSRRAHRKSAAADLRT